MKIQPRTDKKGHTTLYYAPIGSGETKRAGFLRENGKSRVLKKIVDEQAGTITIMVDWDAEKAEQETMGAESK